MRVGALGRGCSRAGLALDLEEEMSRGVMTGAAS